MCRRGPTRRESTCCSFFRDSSGKELDRKEGTCVEAVRGVDHGIGVVLYDGHGIKIFYNSGTPKEEDNISSGYH